MTTAKPGVVHVEGRGIAALLHPRPVYLITTCSSDGSINAASVAWVTPLSHFPPLVGLSIRPTSRTHALIEETGEFVVNIVDTSMCAAVQHCGTAALSGADKVAETGLTLIPVEQVSSSRLEGALGWLECSVERRIEAGDHVLFVARVQAAHAREGFTGSWDAGAASVLQCFAHDRFGTCVETDSGDVESPASEIHAGAAEERIPRDGESRTGGVCS